ncbi:MAG: hypothetical protein QX189_03685 [Methylococcales bacterium]
MMESNGFRDCENIRHSAKNAVIPAWMLESSHKDVESCYEKLLFIIIRLPSVALDSGIPARMTGLIVQYLKMNILLGTTNTFTVSLVTGGKRLKLFYSCVFF